MLSKSLSVLTPQDVPGPGKAQAAEANKPKKRVRFYPVVQCIYYDEIETTPGELLRFDVVPGGEGRRLSHKNISVIFGL